MMNDDEELEEQFHNLLYLSMEEELLDLYNELEESSTDEEQSIKISRSTKKQNINEQMINAHKSYQDQIKEDEIKDVSLTYAIKAIYNINTVNPNNIVQNANYLSSIILSKPSRIKVLIDTGAENINLISKKLFLEYQKRDNEIKLQKTDVIIIPIGNQPLKTEGTVQIPIILSDEICTQKLEFVVVKNLGQYDMLLGLPAIQH